MEKPVPYKTIFQINYKPELKFYDLLIPSAQRLDEYPHWRTDVRTVILRDYDKHCSIIIGHKSFAYEQDSEDTDMEIKYIQRALEELPSSLQIEIFNRFGYRRKYLINVKMSFESLVSILHVKLFSQDAKLRNILPPHVEDLMYRLDFSDKPYRYHVTVGPVHKAEMPRYINYNLENHLDPQVREEEYKKIIENYPKVAVFIDIDFYQEGDKLKKDESTSFLKTARAKINEFANDLTEYLFNIELEA